MSKIENYSISGEPGDNELLFTALGGLGAIGMNFYAYGHKGKWLIVDFGIGFAGDDIPGVDIILPDPTFLEERKNDIAGLVITHAHEDHLGALAYLYDRIDCPIYATQFTANVASHKLKDGGHNPDKCMNVIDAGAKFKVGPFDLEFIDLTHSIPEPQGLIIRTNAGLVLHTGDWKFDDAPLIGNVSDKDKLKAIGDEGVLAIVGDSTNVMTKGHSESEGDVRVGMEKVIASLSGKIAVTCFASNVARVESIALAARANGRKVALAGRSLWRMVGCAKDAGYLQNCPELYEADEVKHLADDEVVYICTGSQGEWRAALARVARGEHRDVKLGDNDTVIFSARAIPGNEKSIGDIQNMLVVEGVHIITAKDAMIHASGHGARDEIRAMYDLIKPRFAIPMHGEALHLARHGQLAEDSGVEEAHILDNGILVSIGQEGINEVDEVYVSSFAMDGDKITATDSAAVRQRRKMAHGGLVVATAVVDKEGHLLTSPQITAEGIPLPAQAEREEMLQLAEKAVDKMSNKDKVRDEAVSEVLRRSIRRYLFSATGKKPQVKVHLVRV